MSKVETAKNFLKTIGKKVAIVQSNYIPWKDYFDLINMVVDEFIVYDDMQYKWADSGIGKK